MAYYIHAVNTRNVSAMLLRCKKTGNLARGTQRQFFENICSEDDLRSKIFGTFVGLCCKISCLLASPRIFEHLQNGIITHF